MKDKSRDWESGKKGRKRLDLPRLKKRRRIHDEGGGERREGGRGAIKRWSERHSHKKKSSWHVGRDTFGSGVGGIASASCQTHNATGFTKCGITKKVKSEGAPQVMQMYGAFFFFFKGSHALLMATRPTYMLNRLTTVTLAPTKHQNSTLCEMHTFHFNAACNKNLMHGPLKAVPHKRDVKM